jgi:hypothetical protein
LIVRAPACAAVSRLHVGTDPIGIDRRQQIIPEERDEVLQELGLAPAAATQGDHVRPVGCGVLVEADRGLRARQLVEPCRDLVHPLVIAVLGEPAAVAALRGGRPEAELRALALFRDLQVEPPDAGVAAGDAHRRPSRRVAGDDPAQGPHLVFQVGETRLDEREIALCRAAFHATASG